MGRAKGFARDLYLFLFKKHGLDPDCDCEVCSDAEGTSPSDFTEDIGKAILMLSYAYRWVFRKSILDSCLADEMVDANVNQCQDQLYSYALVFSSVSCKRPDVLKILVICSFISEMYLFLNVCLGHNGGSVACSYLEQARVCFVNIFQSVIRKRFDEECVWRNLAYSARKISSGYGLYKPFMNAENVLSETPSPLITRATHSSSSEDDDSVRSEDETIFTPPKSGSVLESRKRKRLLSVTSKYRTLYAKSNTRGQFSQIEHMPTLNPVDRSSILQNISLMKERFESRLSLEARYSTPSLDPQIGSIAPNEGILDWNKQLTSFEGESSRHGLNSCDSSAITGNDGMTLQDCYLKSEEGFTQDFRVESNVPEMRSQGCNAEMGGDGLSLQECNFILEQLNLDSDIEVQSIVPEMRSQGCNAKMGGDGLSLQECNLILEHLNLDSDIEVQSNIQEMNSQCSNASTGKDNRNLPEQCIANQTECPQSTSDPVLGNSAPENDILYSGKSSSAGLFRYRLVGWDPVNSRLIWVRERIVEPVHLVVVLEPLTQTGQVNTTPSDNPQIKRFVPAPDSSNPTSELKMMHHLNEDMGIGMANLQINIVGNHQN